MGFYSEYLDAKLNFLEISSERKKQLKNISELLESKDILVFASDLTKKAPTAIDYSDILPFQDQISNLKGTGLILILETPGGFAEVVEDIVCLIRKKYDYFQVIIPGYAKSAGTIFAMAADEILMGTTSALGPIDAQVMFNNKRFSAEALIEGLKKIKKEVLETGKLNPAYIPILQNLSPGELQHCENEQNFSQELVYEWLAKYKFKNWKTHSSNGKQVSNEDKVKRAKEVARKLCSHSKWLTHGRSLNIDKLVPPPKGSGNFI